MNAYARAAIFVIASVIVVPRHAVAVTASCRPVTDRGSDGAHNESRREWWRLLAHLTAATGNTYDLAVTFARFKPAVNRNHGDRSDWTVSHVMPASAILVDRARHRAAVGTRLERDGVALAHVANDRLDVSVGDWILRASRESRARGVRLHVAFAQFTIDLEQAPVRAPVAYDAAPGCAYAYPRSRVTGTVNDDGKAFAVSGTSWLDHEYTPSGRDSDLASERFVVLFDDGRELLLRAKPAASRDELEASGILVGTDGSARSIAGNDASIINPLGTTHTSRLTQRRYPSLWELYSSRFNFDLAAVPPVQDLEIPSSDRADGSYVGPLDVENVSLPEGSHGHGFVEIVRPR